MSSNVAARRRAPRHRASRIRVVYLINQLGMGGSERQLALLLAHLDPARFETHVVVFNPSPHQVLNRSLEDRGVGVWPVPESCRSVPRRILHLRRRLRALAPHVVHSWSVHQNAYAQVAGALARVPLTVGSVRGSVAASSLQEMPWIFRWLCLDRMPHLVVNSQAAAGQLRDRGIAAERIFVLPNGVELPAARVAGEGLAGELEALGIPGEAPLVGTVGNLRRIKNQAMFVDAMGRVLPRQPQARAVIVGQELATEPEVPKLLRRRIEQLGLERKVILAGFRADVLDWISRFSVLCLTSHSEGMPNAVLEAMAAGRPVVATRVGGVGELVREGREGFLVEPGDSEALAAAVDQLLGDPALAQRLGASGRRRAEAAFGCPAAARRLEGYYAGLTGLRPGGRSDVE